MAARAELEAIRLERSELRLGIFQSAAVRLLPRLVGHLSRVRPDLALELSERADDGLLLQQLARGGLDACFAVLPVGPGPFATAHVLDDPYLVLAHADGPLGGATAWRPVISSTCR